MTGACVRVGDGVFAIDTLYVRPRMDASHLIVDSGRAAFVDTGTYFSVPNLLAALAAQGLPGDAVDYILLTHIHLDHAGGAGRLAAALPQAKVLVHPRGAAHMIDPAKLVAATKRVYGEKNYAEHYGEISPIPAARVSAVTDGQRIALGQRMLEFIHTPGHAMHHVCILDLDAREVFTGDTFGVSYREFDVAGAEFILASTSPSQFDPRQLHASVKRIQECEPRAAYLTHFSRVEHLEKLALDLHTDIDVFVRIAQHAAAAPDRIAAMTARIFDYWSQRLQNHGFAGDDAERHALLDGDVALNAAGLDAWLARVAA